MLSIQDATTFYNAYQASLSQYNNVNRFGFNGRFPTIGDWLNANSGIMNALLAINQVNQLNTWICSYAKNYAQYAATSNPGVSVKDIEFWFRGTIGEWFFIDCFLQEYGNGFLVKLPNSNQVQQVAFKLATPTMYTGCADYGVDLLGIDNNGNGVVGQVKFYNPWSNEPTQINYETLSKTDCQGLNEEWIDPKQEKSIYLFWLGDKKQGSLHCNLSKWLLDKNCPLTKYNRVVYVDGNDVNTNIQPVFWSSTFQQKINLL